MRYYTSDPHFADPAVLTPEFSSRPFATIEEHDECLLDEINTLVQPRDELIIAGDFCRSNGYRKPGYFRNRINCRSITLVYGNHDKQSYATHFSRAVNTLMLKIEGHEQPNGRALELFISHYAHAYWPSSHYGSLHAYGHCHDQREQTLDLLFPGRRSTDIGVDTAKRLLGKFRPFSETELINMLLPRPGHDNIEWYITNRENKR